MSEPRTAVGYARMSSDQQQASIPQQLEWLERAARAEGLTLARVFEDHGIAGDDLTRPGLQALLTYTEKTRPGVLVVWNLDRVSRAGSFETGAIFGRLEAAGCRKVVTQERTYDLAEPVDRLLINVGQDLTRKAYAQAIARNAARGRLKAALAGKWQAQLPFGYGKDAGGRLVPLEAEAAAVRRAFALYLGGESLGGVAQKVGLGWSRMRVRNTLVNPVYAGHTAWGREGTGKYARVCGHEVKQVASGAKADRKPGVLVQNTHEPIVSQQTWDAVQARMRSRHRRYTTPTPGAVWLFSGVVRCQCGSAMTGLTVRNKKSTSKLYRCVGAQQKGAGHCGHGRVLAGRLLDAVAGEVRRSISAPELLADIRRAMEEQAGRAGDERAAEAARLEAELTDLDGKTRRAADRVLTCDPSILADVQDAASRLRKRREEAAARLLAVRAAGEDAAASHDRVTKAMLALERLGETLASPKDPVAAKELLQTCVEKVVVRFDTVVTPAGKYNRHPVSHVEIHLADRLVHLLGSS